MREDNPATYISSESIPLKSKYLHQSGSLSGSSLSSFLNPKQNSGPSSESGSLIRGGYTSINPGVKKFMTCRKAAGFAKPKSAAQMFVSLQSVVKLYMGGKESHRRDSDGLSRTGATAEMMSFRFSCWKLLVICGANQANLLSEHGASPVISATVSGCIPDVCGEGDKATPTALC